MRPQKQTKKQKKQKVIKTIFNITKIRNVAKYLYALRNYYEGRTSIYTQAKELKISYSKLQLMKQKMGLDLDVLEYLTSKTFPSTGSHKQAIKSLVDKNTDPLKNGRQLSTYFAEEFPTSLNKSHLSSLYCFLH